MKSIDIKSLLIGILGTALVMVLMGQSRVTENRWQTSCSDSGRCVVFDTIKGKFHGMVFTANIKNNPRQLIDSKYHIIR